MAQPAERKGGGKKPTEHIIVLGRAHAGAADILGGMDNKIPLGNDCEI